MDELEPITNPTPPPETKPKIPGSALFVEGVKSTGRHMTPQDKEWEVNLAYYKDVVELRERIEQNEKRIERLEKSLAKLIAIIDRFSGGEYRWHHQQLQEIRRGMER